MNKTFHFQRIQKRRSDLTDKLDPIMGLSLKGVNGDNWNIDANFDELEDVSIARVKQNLIFTYEYVGNANQDRADREIQVIESNLFAALKKTIPSGGFKQLDNEGNPISGTLGGEANANPVFVKWDKLAELTRDRPDPLWLPGTTDEEIEEHPCFSHIFGQAHVIRSLLRAIFHAIDSEGKHCAHTILHGQPGAAKSTIMDAVINYINEPVIDWDPECAAAEKIDAESATNAGVRNRIINLANGVEGCPPIMFFEEAEKVSEDFWKGLLGVFDYRQTLVRLTNRGKTVASTPTLGLGTVNNMTKFETFASGAVNSRFSNRIVVARPSPTVMRRILHHKVREIGGNPLWADAAMDFAHEIKERDPRRIINFLVGRDSLLNYSYQEDCKKNLTDEHNIETEYQHEESEVDDWFFKNLKPVS